MLRQLRNIRRQVPTAVFQSLVVALVLSRLDYCNRVLAGLSANLIRRLQSVQNTAAWLIYGIWRSEHITDVLISLHWLCVPERILFKIAVTTYRALNGSAPLYLSSYFTRVTDVPSNQLAVPPFNLSTVGKRAFPVSGANFWNSRPSHVTSAPSLAIFWQRLKTFLFHQSYPDLIFLFSSCFIVDLPIILLFRPH